MGSLPGLPIYFNLVIRQQPLQSRTCGVGDKVDRRPIDPPLIIELQMHNGYHQLLLPEEYMTDLFMTAVLVPAARTTTTSSSTQQQVDLSLHSQLTVGRTVSSLYLFKDLDYIPKCFFVFSDLSIRVEGRYRFQLSLFQIQGTSVTFLQSIFTDEFTVYSAKKFPGMFGSCPLARCFAEQGLKIRIRSPSKPRQPRRRQQQRNVDTNQPTSTTSSSGDLVEDNSDNDDHHSTIPTIINNNNKTSSSSSSSPSACSSTTNELSPSFTKSLDRNRDDEHYNEQNKKQKQASTTTERRLSLPVTTTDHHHEVELNNIHMTKNTATTSIASNIERRALPSFRDFIQQVQQQQQHHHRPPP